MEASAINDVVIKYGEFVAEENVLIQRVEVCRKIIEVILKYLSEQADAIHILTAEDIVTSIHTMHQDLEIELLHVRLEKSLLENKISILEANGNI
ncbi:hypothetical protein GCM10008018_58730 [Paenibacillus marchantiophytorum]|uniref:Uncharacterized protein n=1 Tax=Paenibacillus marchantiophytorum TaxID=1619310 RepID=A0ABQ1FAG5_9BACL|nr:hypothetical protein GCM10008018_58730 [Paenibacillus marchantiophytorum]